MSHILVVDDSPTQAQQVVFLLEDAGFTAETADNGAAALAALARREDGAPVPDLVVTDLQMPEMNGLELVEEVRVRHPLVPIVLMTAFGSEDIALQALRSGAASYVPKKNLSGILVDTVVRVLESAQAGHDQRRLYEFLVSTEYRFELENDVKLIAPLISHLSETIARRKFCTDNDLLRLTIAWSEALTNAIHHGNLEVSSDLRQDDERVYQHLIAQRQQEEPYRSRRVHVTAKVSSDEAVYVIRDEGPGFNVAGLPDPNDLANLDRVGGRGLLLIRTFMDSVAHNHRGNELTMSKRRR
jgi:CheY-like chemotaxis protein/anti-sigma regulatory factor (Ser/Thr protein kinase)